MESRCDTCNGEGYMSFWDQGEPDMDSKCFDCGGSGKKVLNEIKRLEKFIMRDKDEK